VTDFDYIVFGKGNLIITPILLSKWKAPSLFCHTWDGNPMARLRNLGYYFLVLVTEHL